jgi:phosphonopyruvate decarboxylase
MRRAEALQIIQEVFGPKGVLLSTTGMISRELFALGDRPNQFYMIGSMGLLSSFGLAVSLLRPERPVVILDGDGSFLMGLSTLPLMANGGRLIHLVLDNGIYESTGGQPRPGGHLSLADIAASAGYRNVYTLSSPTELRETLDVIKPGPSFFWIKVSPKGTPGIGRVSIPPEVLTQRLREYLKSESETA